MKTAMRSIPFGQYVVGVISVIFMLLGTQHGAIGSEIYRLGSHDNLGIDVFDEPELTKKVEVDGQGNIKYPLLGDIHVEGMTIKEVEDTLISGLKAGFLKNPKVTVYIVKYRNFYVHGEAIRPGAYPYQTGLTVLKAVALAGGFTDKADKKHLKVIRTIKGKEKRLTVKIDDYIRPDDVLIVLDETNIVLDGTF